MMRILTLWIFLAVTIPGLGLAFTLPEFQGPESMQSDSEDGAYYVANINGDPFLEDGNGFISKISANSNTVIQKFIGGKLDGEILHAPKGLLIIGDEIYVTDLNKIKVFNKISSKLVREIDLSVLGANSLKAMARDSKGVIYVTDMLQNKIFKVTPHKNFEVSLFIEGQALGQPNGLMVNPRTQNLMVVSWKNGEIMEIDTAGRIHKLKRGLSTLCGIDYDIEGSIYVSSFNKGEIYRIPNFGRGVLSIYLSGLAAPADISCDRIKHELLIPLFNENAVTTHALFTKESRRLQNALNAKKEEP